jgi:hypothetical protein
MSMRREEFGEEVSASVLVFQFPDGTSRPVKLRVGKPYQVSAVEWACPVEISGFERRYVDVRGEDSMQALCMAISLIRMRLEDFLEKGGKVLGVDDLREWDPRALWATFGRVGFNGEDVA